MPSTLAQSDWRSLEALFDVGALGSLPDAELLDRFRTDREVAGQEAFRILVERHGSMVLALCRSIVKDPHDAEDAFQATFLVLVRKADSIRRRDTIAPWLHGVATRVARRAFSRSRQRRAREFPVGVELPSRERLDLEKLSTADAIHEEIARLPESIRAPVVLCWLEGSSYELAARRLGVTEPTLRGRLYRARMQLESRLRDRGLHSSVVARAVELGRIALPSPTPTLVRTTVQFSTRWSSVAGLVTRATGIPDSIANLSQGVIKIMFVQSCKRAGIMVLLTAGALVTVALAQQGNRAASAVPALPGSGAADLAQPKRDPRATAERGLREVFLTESDVNEPLKEHLKVELPDLFKHYNEHVNKHEFDRPAQITWRELLVDVEKHPSREVAQRKAAVLLARLKKGEDFAELAKAENDGPASSKKRGGLVQTSPGTYAVAAVNQALESLPIGQTSGLLSGPNSFHIVRVENRRAAGPATFNEVQDGIKLILVNEKLLLRTEMIMVKLNQRIDAEFPTGTTIEGVLKHIKKKTADAHFPGIPIYVAPQALSETRQDLLSTISINIKEQPVHVILDQALAKSGLLYFVRDGFLQIDSRTGKLEIRMEEIDRKLDRVLEALARLEKAR